MDEIDALWKRCRPPRQSGTESGGDEQQYQGNAFQHSQERTPFGGMVPRLRRRHSAPRALETLAILAALAMLRA